MKKWKAYGFALVCILFLCSKKEIFAAGEKNNQEIKAEELFYEDGDVVGFVGDSITHAEYTSINYVEFLYQYYLSRFPDREIEFRNLGTASCTVQDVLDIYDRDPAFQGLNQAVILLGMNEAIQGISTETYIADMEKLIGRLKADGLKGEDILILAPTPYDQTCALNYDKNGYPYQRSDDRLTAFTEQLAVKAEEWEVHYVDLHTPMKELSVKLQKEDRKNTLTRGDCIHPEAVGQLVMAYYILQAQGAEKELPELLIPEVPVEVLEDFCRNEQGVRLNWNPEYLPAFTADEFQELLELIPSAEVLGKGILCVEGFPEEVSYELTVGDSVLGDFTGRELQEGVNLAALEENPLRKLTVEIDEKSRMLHKLAAEYRSAVYTAAEAGTGEAWDQLRETWKNWQSADRKLRKELYEKVQAAIKQTYMVSIVEKGYSREALEKESMPAEEFLFEDGDVVGFLGDSITQVSYSGISYPEFLYQYYITRYPQWELEFRNLGTGYYTARHALELYNGESGIYDAALDGITKAVIMFGMNEAQDGEEAETYIQNIRGLVEMLNARGIENKDVILAAPTPYDQTRSSNYKEDGEMKKTVDNILLEYTVKLKQLSQELGTHYVDLHTPMLRATKLFQEKNADGTLTVDDNIHPRAEGSILAGFFFLYQQGAGKEVADVRILGKSDIQTDNAIVSKVKWRGNGDYVSFAYHPYSLPMAISSEVAQTDTDFEIMSRISQENLQVAGLKGRENYTVYMDDIPIGEFTGETLERGVNLAACDWNWGQAAAKEIEGLNQKWQECSSEYRSVLGKATLGERSASQEDVDTAYVIWKEETESLQKQMYEVARTSAARTYQIEIVNKNGRIWMKLVRWKWVVGAAAAIGLSVLAGTAFHLKKQKKKNKN